ncbi:hypothetical protein PHMEG_00019130 [Phytophthora megakarya]|uniref:Uncharacterized protein n=1 Tax=Phytophthora megakarya TaxID=4795 RepID=A0A225VUW3_9STRA|nr:hypothetical protein PHMEG_00019130 [Phytophthora megakarya]
MEPIAKRLKQSAESALPSKKEIEETDIAEQIKRLEEELRTGNDDSSDSDEDETVVNLSVYASELIESLPEKMLPAAKPSSSLPPAKMTRKRAQQEENERAAKKALEQLGDALTFPKKVPFACRPCQFIGKDLEDFQNHRVSTEHSELMQTGHKTLHCVLCNKSFTSPAQLDEHRAGKWHKQRAQQKKSRCSVKVCYDFMRGECKWGDGCNFEHTESKAMRFGRALDKTRKRVCDNFTRTKHCRFGDKCLFSHDTR